MRENEKESKTNTDETQNRTEKNRHPNDNCPRAINNSNNSNIHLPKKNHAMKSTSSRTDFFACHPFLPSFFLSLFPSPFTNLFSYKNSSASLPFYSSPFFSPSFHLYIIFSLFFPFIFLFLLIFVHPPSSLSLPIFPFHLSIFGRLLHYLYPFFHLCLH